MQIISPSRYGAPAEEINAAVGDFIRESAGIVPSVAMASFAFNSLRGLGGVQKGQGFRYGGMPRGLGIRTALGADKGGMRAMGGTLGGAALYSALGMNPMSAMMMSAGANLAPRILGRFTGNRTSLTGVAGFMEAFGSTPPRLLQQISQGTTLNIGQLGPLGHATMGGPGVIGKGMGRVAGGFATMGSAIGNAAIGGINKIFGASFKNMPGAMDPTEAQIVKQLRRMEPGLNISNFGDIVKNKDVVGKLFGISDDIKRLVEKGVAGRMGSADEVTENVIKKILNTSLFDEVEGQFSRDALGTPLSSRTGTFGRRLTGGDVRTAMRGSVGDFMEKVMSVTDANKVHLIRGYTQAATQQSIFGSIMRGTGGKIDDMSAQLATQYGKGKITGETLSKATGFAESAFAGKGDDELAKMLAKSTRRTIMASKATAIIGGAAKIGGGAAIGLTLGLGAFSAVRSGAKRMAEAVENINSSLRMTEFGGGNGAFTNDVVSTERQRALAAMQFLRSGRDFIGQEARLIAESGG